MPRKVSPLLPSSQAQLRRLGERLRLARLRRKLPAKQVAARAGMAPMTLRGVERGQPAVTMGAYVAVMQVLGVEQDLESVASADPTGRALQDARLPTQARVAPHPRPVSAASRAAAPAPDAGTSGKVTQKRKTRARSRAATGGFTTARALADLLDRSPTSRPSRRRR